MERFTIVIGALLGLQLVLRTVRLRRFPIPRTAISIGCLLLVHWMGSTVLNVAAGLLALWFVIAEVRGLLDRYGDLRKQLASDDPADLVQAVEAANEMGTEEAQRLLLDHLATEARGDDRKVLLVFLHSLVEGWGMEAFLKRWNGLQAETQTSCLEALMGSTGFPAEMSLKISRHAMDADEPDSAAGWRTYASVVTAGFDQHAGGMNPQVWLQESAEDSNEDVQGLRSRLEQKRTAATQTQGVDALVSRYRRDVFIHPPATPVQLYASRDFKLQDEQAEELHLPKGAYTATLSGKFDNAQDAVAAGWSFYLQLFDVGGKPWELTVTWHAAEFFGEILNELHCGERCWFDEAPEELGRAFSTQAFVGPVVSYGDSWSGYSPTVDGDTLALGEKQLLKCLVSIAPTKEGEPTRLCFLLYGIEDGAAEGVELRPFVTTISLERLILSAAEEGVVELPVVTFL